MSQINETETVTFEYNEDGLRTKKTATSTGVTEYTLHGKKIVHMTQGSHVLHFYYDAQSKPSIVIYDGTPYAYLYNLQGDVIALMDGAGAKVVEYAYDAWGKVLSTTGSLAATLGIVQPFRYRGYVYDVETELYYLRSRYYNPAWLRFLCADKLIDKNLYCYCNNDPIGHIDVNGNNPIGNLGSKYDSLALQYPTMNSKKPGLHEIKEKMSAAEFIAHLWQAYKDPLWIYTYGHAQFRDTDCVGLYKAIMEWYYNRSSFNQIIKITSGINKGSDLNQVKDLIQFGIIDGEDGLYDICPCCGEPPIGAAVFCYKTKEEGNETFSVNNGWTHVGYYIGNGIVIEAADEITGVTISSLYDSKWDCYGLLKGIGY